MNERPEPQHCDNVIVDGRWLRIRDVSEDRGTKLSDGRWVRASDLEFVTNGLWRYEPQRPACVDNVDCRSLQCLRGCRRAGGALTQETQDDERRERYAAAIESADLYFEVDHRAIADAAMAVADEERETDRRHLDARRIELLRVNERHAEENDRLRAELSEARATIGRFRELVTQYVHLGLRDILLRALDGPRTVANPNRTRVGSSDPTTRRVVEHALNDYGYSADVATRIVDNMLSEHAHELAERIRTRADEIARKNDFDMEACVLAGEWDKAADLLDPEVSE